jgi:predicted acylesterase/phospholipase RssA
MAYRRWYNRKFGELGVKVAHRWPERGIIEAKGKQTDTLGLALSGGGYRSAIFNYGVLKGLYELGVIGQFDYLSVVSGGSWIGTAFAMSRELRWFFDSIEDHPNLIEEGFESFLANPLRAAQELRLARKTPNYISNVYGRLLARTFLREHGQESRYRQLATRGMLREGDRPFLIMNGTVNFRRPDEFAVTQEGFEMTRLYCGSRSLGYLHAKDVLASEKPIRIRDAIAISGAAVALHLPALGGEVAGIGLSREVVNYAKEHSASAARVTDADHLDVADGGHYNNLGVESLINRGCGYIVVVDAEHDPETKTDNRSNQKYSGLRTLLKRHHIRTPFGVDGDQVVARLDEADQPVHLFEGDDTIPDILYVKLKSWDRFDRAAASQPYNQPGFLDRLFGGGDFAFDPQFSTAKLDYDFFEHRNLSELGTFIVKEHEATVRSFVDRSE